MQSQMMALLCMAEGSSVIVENVFENRFQIVDELNNDSGLITRLESFIEILKERRKMLYNE